MKKCPYCAELIQDEAIVCRFCGRDLPKAVPPVPIQAAIVTPPPAKKAQRSVWSLGAILALVLTALSGIATVVGSSGPEMAGELMTLPILFVVYWLAFTSLFWVGRKRGIYVVLLTLLYLTLACLLLYRG